MAKDKKKAAKDALKGVLGEWSKVPKKAPGFGGKKGGKGKGKRKAKRKKGK